MRSEPTPNQEPDQSTPPHLSTTPTQALEEALQEVERLEALWRSRRAANGLAYYVPTEKQYQAHCATARVVCFCGGNRSGKSTAGAAEVGWQVTGQYPAWYPQANRRRGPQKAVVLATAFPNVDRVIEPKLLSLLPKGTYRLQRTHERHLSTITLQNGSRIDLLTQEMADDACEGADWDVAWVDEPVQRIKWEAIQRGLLDRRGRAFLTFTPLTEAWMKAALVDAADGVAIAVITASLWETQTRRDGMVIHAPEDIRAFEASLPEEVRQSRVYGRFFHLRGQVYPSLGTVHTLDRAAYAYPDPVWCVIDPHDRKPHHVLWAMVTRQDDVTCIGEWTGHVELPELARTILARERAEGWRMKARLIDPNFGKSPSRVGTNVTVIDELGRHGCATYPAIDDVALGHLLVREALHYDRTRPVTATNRPKLYLVRTACPETLRSLQSLQYAEWQTSGQRDPKELEQDYLTDGADCVRYLCCARPRWSAPQAVPYYDGLTHAAY